LFTVITIVTTAIAIMINTIVTSTITVMINNNVMLYQVAWGSQKRRTNMAAWQEGRARWGQNLAFVSALPMKPRPFQVVLYHKERKNSPSRAIARAFIPLTDLLPSDGPGGL
jgi:hypothetical protein